MNAILDRIVNFCLDKDIVKTDYAEWFRYGLERRLTTLFVGIPFVILGCLISNIQCAIAFFFSFFFLRAYMNGYHAKTVFRCLLSSLILEGLFLGVISRWINQNVSLIIMAISVVTAFTLAPYNHPNMHLSDDELIACKQKVRSRSSILTVVWTFSWLARFDHIAKGIALGSAMAGMLLCFAYISERRNHNEKTARENVESL